MMLITTTRTLSLLALAMLVFSADAQTSTVSATPAQVISVIPAVGTCPVGLTAQRGAGMGVVKRTRNSQPGPSQSLQVAFSNMETLGITRAVFDVHGLNGVAHVTPAAVGSTAVLPPANRTVSQTATLSLTVEGHTRNTAELTVNGLTSITSLDLVALTYTDGSQWHAQTPASCHIVPNGLMLVAAAASPDSR